MATTSKLPLVIIRALTGRKYPSEKKDAPIVSILTYPLMDIAGDYVKPDGGIWIKSQVPICEDTGGVISNWTHRCPIGVGIVKKAKLTFNGESNVVFKGETQFFKSTSQLDGVDLTRFDNPIDRNPIGKYSKDEAITIAQQAEKLVRADIATGVSIEFRVKPENEGTDFWKTGKTSELEKRPSYYFKSWQGTGYAHARIPVNPGCRTLLPEENSKFVKAICLDITNTGKFENETLHPLILKSFLNDTLLEDTKFTVVIHKAIDQAGFSHNKKGQFDGKIHEHLKRHGRKSKRQLRKDIPKEDEEDDDETHHKKIDEALDRLHKKKKVLKHESANGNHAYMHREFKSVMSDDDEEFDKEDDKFEKKDSLDEELAAGEEDDEDELVEDGEREPADESLEEDDSAGVDEPSPGIKTLLNAAQFFMDGHDALTEDIKHSDSISIRKYVHKMMKKLEMMAEECAEMAEKERTRLAEAMQELDNDEESDDEDEYEDDEEESDDDEESEEEEGKEEEEEAVDEDEADSSKEEPIDESPKKKDKTPVEEEEDEEAA